MFSYCFASSTEQRPAGIVLSLEEQSDSRAALAGGVVCRSITENKTGFGCAAEHCCFAVLWGNGTDTAGTGRCWFVSGLKGD